MILPLNELHIWQTNINISNEIAETLLQTLSDEEKKRAMRFKFDEHRNKFIKARHTLRTILTKYTNVPAELIQFAENKYGRPFIVNNKIYFNISHAQDMALYAISHNKLIGIDIEYVDRNVNVTGIYKRFFSEKECAIIDQLSENKKIETFFKFWTAKEAFIKAIGEGLTHPLKSFDIGINNDEVYLERIQENKENAAKWSIFPFTVPENYESSIAIRSIKPRIVTFEL